MTISHSGLLFFGPPCSSSTAIPSSKHYNARTSQVDIWFC